MTRLREHFLERHWVVTGVLVVGLTATLVVVATGEARHARDAAEVADRRALFVVDAVERSVRATMDDARAAAGLFLASEEVTEDEFSRFVLNQDQHPGAVGLGYIPLLDSADLTEVLDGTPGLDLFRFDQAGTTVRSQADQSTRLVRYFVPAPGSNLDLRGFDAASDPAWAEAMERAARAGETQISRLTQLFGLPGEFGYLAVTPITADDGEVVGFTTSVVRMEGLIQGELAESLAQVVLWDVRDVTGDGAPVSTPDRLRRVETLHLGGRIWRVEVTPTEAARQALTGSGLASGLALGLLLTVLAAVVAHLASGAARSRREQQRLERVTAEKDEFLTAISHELRTPLTVVVGMAEILEESTLGTDSEVREYVEMLRQESRALARLVDDLLLVGRLDAQALPVRPEDVDLRWEVERIVGEVDAPPDTTVSVVGRAHAWSDPLRLRHVIRHLYVNALRHGGSTVTIELGDSLHDVRLAVVDDGPGVPDSEVRGLFAASRGRKDTPGGPASLGLGLRISKRLAKAMGGELSYRRAEGRTVFELRLPRSESSPPAVRRASPETADIAAERDE